MRSSMRDPENKIYIFRSVVDNNAKVYYHKINDWDPKQWIIKTGSLEKG